MGNRPATEVRTCGQCNSQTRGGNRCSRRTCKYGIDCWQHTKFNKGLEVKRSEIPGAGAGLFATRDFEDGDLIGHYTGEVKTRAQSERDDTGFAVARDDGMHVDANNTQTEPTRFANDCEGGDFPCDNNAEFLDEGDWVPDGAGGERWQTNRLDVRATADIEAGDEIYLNYGQEYWADDD